MVAAFRRRFHGGDDRVGPNPAGDERLRAVDDVAPGDLAGVSPDRGHVGARIGFCDGERGDELPADSRHQVALLLLLGPEAPDRGQCDPRMGADPGGNAAGAAARQLLDEDGVGHRVLGAAVARGELQPQIALFGKPPEHLGREPPRVLPLLGMGIELGFHEPPHTCSQLLVIVGKRRHGPPGNVGAGI